MGRAVGRGIGWSGGWRKDWDLKNELELTRHKGGDYECSERGLGLVRAP